jgi:hypothetical protein
MVDAETVEPKPPLNTVMGKIFNIIFNMKSDAEKGRAIYELIDGALAKEKKSYQAAYAKWERQKRRSQRKTLP